MNVYIMKCLGLLYEKYVLVALFFCFFLYLVYLVALHSTVDSE